MLLPFSGHVRILKVQRAPLELTDDPVPNRLEIQRADDASKKITEKEARKDRDFKARIDHYRRNTCHRIRMAKDYADLYSVSLISVLAEMDSKNTNPVKKTISKMRKRMVARKFGLDCAD
tara:strand:- start:723 stop:1082 length:360 start_codon:yes stop_codon:yes gene_type:complete